MTTPHDPGQPGDRPPPGEEQPQEPQQWGGRPAPQPAPAVPDLEPVSRPVTVEIAFWISVVAPLVTTALYALTFFLMRGFVQEVLHAELAGHQPGAAGVAGGLLVFFFVVVIFFFAVLTALWIVFGCKLRAGRNWARITLTAFAAVWALSGVSGLVNGGEGWAGGELPPDLAEPAGLTALGFAQSGLELVAMVAFLVLVYVRPSQRYFAAAGAQR